MRAVLEALVRSTPKVKSTLFSHADDPQTRHRE
jgi:hypothetical protein